MKVLLKKIVLPFLLLIGIQTIYAQKLRHVQQKTADGILEGIVSPDNTLRTFKGIPYAAPPVGALRWKAPQPVKPWSGVRKAVDYAPRSMQGRIYDDMVFNDPGPSEDCLYLNLWIPENNKNKLPVMVWIHGGGFVAGSSSEPRQDAGELSQKGVLVVSFNYRMGIFGFFTHPDLTKESAHNSSGNYGLLDQVAALEWVKKNIAEFGGDPNNVTIFGESAGSRSVSALMASPLARGLFHRAIGESGAFFGNNIRMMRLAEAEQKDVNFAESEFGTASLEALREMSAQKILDAALKKPRKFFYPIIDGYFLPTDCFSIYKSGNQSHIPLLAGWNKDEGNFESFFGDNEPTINNYAARAKAIFGSNSEEFLKLYPAVTVQDVKRAAQDFAGDKANAYSTWKWLEMHLITGESNVFRYKFDHSLPLPTNALPGTEPSASHASEIEFVFGVISSRNLPWRKEDYKMSELISSYWTNFAKTGNPNGPDLPKWNTYNSRDSYSVMYLDANPGSAPDKIRDRYKFLDRLFSDQ